MLLTCGYLPELRQVSYVRRRSSQRYLEAEVTRTGGKPAADLGSLLGLVTGRKAEPPRGCWPAEGETKHRRGCWPNASDLPSDDVRPEDAIRKIMRRGWL